MPKKWLYGDAGDRIPVKFGDIWSVGDNLFSCGDIEQGAAQSLLAWFGNIPDVFYSDPPWDKGNAKSFRTKAEMSRDVDFGKFLNIIARLTTHTKSYAFVEMGIREFGNLKDSLLNYWPEIVGEYEINYYGNRPCRMAVVGEGFDYPDMNGVDDDKTPFLVAQAAWQKFGNDFYMFDPCIGRGIVAEAALSVGAKVIGNELSNRRLAVTLDKVSNHLGVVPEKVGVL